MAINEACSLWIEQRISEELEEKEITGKSLREIGREISAEIERIFEAKVKPETLTMKASRMQGVTNVTPESKVIETITETPKILENRHPQGGGTRKNAGRKSADYCQPAIALGEKEILAAAKEIRNEQRELKRGEIIEKLENIKTKTAKEIDGVYDVLVIDPPWPMQKIERDERPNQSEFEYPTMAESELEILKIPSADDCHVWLWTTHKFLPMAFRLIDVWGLKYVCVFVWHKPGGFQPIGLPQYNCEFALYARKGTPQFINTKAFPVCFNSPRGAHSEKPEDFYDVVRRVTAGRRLDMFNRRKIEGFDGWGIEAL